MWRPIVISIFWISLCWAAQPTKKIKRTEKFHLGSIAADCAVGEELKICRPSCEPTCNNLEPECFQICSTAKCICMHGFVRMNGICIPKQACQLFSRFAPQKPARRKPVTGKKVTKPPPSSQSPKLSRTAKLPKTTTPRSTKATPPPEIIIKPARPPPQCGRGQQFTLCVCDSTCEFEKVCKSCSSGCGCFPHFLRNEEGLCVPKSQCTTINRIKTIKIFEVPEDDYDEPTTTLPATTTTETTTTTPRTTKTTTQPASTTSELPRGPAPPAAPARPPANRAAPGVKPIRTGPPSITPFTFFRHKRIQRRKAALKKLLQLV